MKAINLTGNIPVFKNQPSTLTNNNKYVIWDNDEKTLFKLDLETNIWESLAESTDSSRTEQIKRLFSLPKGKVGAIGSENGYWLVEQITGQSYWNETSKLASRITCFSEDCEEVFTLRRNSSYMSPRIDLESYKSWESLYDTFATRAGSCQFEVDCNMSFVHHYNNHIWGFEYNKLKRSEVIALNRYSKRVEYVSISCLPEINEEVLLFEIEWPRAVLLVVKGSSSVYSIGYIDLKYSTYIPILKHETSAKELSFLFCWNSKLYFIEHSYEESNKLSKLWTLGLLDYSRCFGLRTLESTRKMNFVEDFKRLSCMDEFKDFEIVGTIETPNFSKRTRENESIPDDQYDKSNSIKVHKAVLIARWPYFRTLISSGMKESQKNQLLIPEPTPWLKALVEYFYSNSIPEDDTNLCGGLLILARLYDLQQLKEVCLDYLFSMSTFQKAIKVWEFANIQGEVSLAYEASRICYEKWQDARPDDLENLDHSLLASLCLNNPYAKKQK